MFNNDRFKDIESRITNCFDGDYLLRKRLESLERFLKIEYKYFPEYYCHEKETK